MPSRRLANQSSVGLIIPAVFSSAVNGVNVAGTEPSLTFEAEVLRISRACSVMLLSAFFVYVCLNSPIVLLLINPSYVFFQIRSHHGLYDEIYEHDEMHDRDREKDLKKAKLTFTECMLALAIALTCVSLIAVFLVEEIEFIVVDRGVSDA